MDYKGTPGISIEEPDDSPNNDQKKEELVDRLDQILYEFDESPDSSVLIRLNWIMKEIDFSIEEMYEKYELLPKLINMLSPRTADCEFVFRIILYSARYYRNLLCESIEYLDTILLYIRSPKLFGYVIQFINGILKFVDEGANVLEEHKTIEILSSVALSLPFADMGVACHFIALILGSVEVDRYDDFDRIVLAPINLINNYINDIQDDDELITHLQNPNYISALSPLFLLLDSMLKLYNGSLSEILTEGIYNRLVKTTQNWPAVDSTGALIGHVFMIWNRIVCDFYRDFVEMDICHTIVTSIMKTMSHENMPRSRAIFLLSNIAATELVPVLIEHNVMEALFEVKDKMNSSEQENMLFLFMNMSQTCPEYISEAFFTRALADECLSAAPAASSPMFLTLTVHLLCLLKDSDPEVFDCFDPDDIEDFVDAASAAELDDKTAVLMDGLTEFLETGYRETELEQLAPAHH